MVDEGKYGQSNAYLSELHQEITNLRNQKEDTNRQIVLFSGLDD
jgi:hypothetical protein